MNGAEKLIEECQKIQSEIRRLNDVLVDMIKTHEKNLLDIAGRIDQNFQYRESESENDHPIAVVDCRKWSEFKELSTGTSLVAYEMDVWNVFSITSARREFIFRYSERLPISRNNVTPKDSVCHKALNLNPASLRRWLSEELRVPEEKIIEGNLAALSQHMYQHRDNPERDNTVLQYYSNI